MARLATWFELWVWLKVINAGLIALGVAWLVVRVLRQAGSEPMLARRAKWLALIVSLQLVLAGATWVTNYGWPAWFTRGIWPLQSAILAQGRWLVLLTTAHAAVGSLTLVAVLSLALWLRQMPGRSSLKKSLPSPKAPPLQWGGVQRWQELSGSPTGPRSAVRRQAPTGRGSAADT